MDEATLRETLLDLAQLEETIVKLFSSQPPTSSSLLQHKIQLLADAVNLIPKHQIELMELWTEKVDALERQNSSEISETPLLDTILAELNKGEATILQLLTTKPLPFGEIEPKLLMFEKIINRIPNECCETVNEWKRKLTYLKNRYRKAQTAVVVEKNVEAVITVETVTVSEPERVVEQPAVVVAPVVAPPPESRPSTPVVMPKCALNIELLQHHLVIVSTNILEQSTTMPLMSPTLMEQTTDELVARFAAFEAECCRFLEETKQTIQATSSGDQQQQNPSVAMLVDLSSPARQQTPPPHPTTTITPASEPPSIDDQLKSLEVDIKQMMASNDASSSSRLENKMEQFLELSQRTDLTESMKWQDRAAELMQQYLIASGVIEAEEPTEPERILVNLESTIIEQLSVRPLPTAKLEAAIGELMMKIGEQPNSMKWHDRAAKLMQQYLLVSGTIKAEEPVKSTAVACSSSLGRHPLPPSNEPHFEPTEPERNLIILESTIIEQLGVRPLPTEKLEAAISELMAKIGKLPEEKEALVNQWNDKAAVLMGSYATAAVELIEVEKGINGEPIQRTPSLEQLREFLMTEPEEAKQQQQQEKQPQEKEPQLKQQPEVKIEPHQQQQQKTPPRAWSPGPLDSDPLSLPHGSYWTTK